MMRIVLFGLVCMMSVVLCHAQCAEANDYNEMATPETNGMQIISVDVTTDIVAPADRTCSALGGCGIGRCGTPNAVARTIKAVVHVPKRMKVRRASRNRVLKYPRLRPIRTIRIR